MSPSPSPAPPNDSVGCRPPPPSSTAARSSGAQATLGLDEALNGVPGVYIANRYNYSLDQRLSIRGFGSRAPFGTRGVKILLDGIPQTTPDGQSQFTNLELSTIGRIEVLARLGLVVVRERRRWRDHPDQRPRSPRSGRYSAPPGGRVVRAPQVAGPGGRRERAHLGNCLRLAYDLGRLPPAEPGRCPPAQQQPAVPGRSQYDPHVSIQCRPCPAGPESWRTHLRRVWRQSRLRRRQQHPARFRQGQPAGPGWPGPAPPRRSRQRDGGHGLRLRARCRQFHRQPDATAAPRTPAPSSGSIATSSVSG